MQAPRHWRRFSRDRWALIGLGIVTTLTLLALAAPWIAPADPLRGSLLNSLRSPSREFWLGTDVQGRDLLARLLFGARLSLAVGLISQTVASVLGVGLGLAAGYYGRWVDGLLMRLADVTLAFPSLLLLIAIAAAVNPSLPVVFVVIGLVGWAGMARLVRGEVLSLRTREYVQAAVVTGQTNWWIIWREILPNALSPVIVLASLMVATAILLESSLSFLGLGDPNLMSWGYMVGAGRTVIRQAWWITVFPGIAILVSVLALNLIGEGLNDALNPRLAKGGR